MQILSIADNQGKIYTTLKTNSLGTLELYKQGLFVEGKVDGDSFYINPTTKEVEPRPEQSTQLNESTLTLTGLPDTGYITINGVEYAFNESTIELDLSKGKYNIQISSFPFKDINYEISV